MRNFLMNFGVSVPEYISEEYIDHFQDNFVDIVEDHGFTCGGGMIEVDQAGRRLDGFKTDGERLTIYDQVNGCETLKELADVIRSLADEQGMIQGRSRKFKAEQMAYACEHYGSGYVPANSLTREFGIRQQALYIDYFTPNKSLQG